MNSALEIRAETLKLARLLRREPEEFEYLEQIAAADLRQLREQVTELMFTAQGTALARLATASKLLPVRVVATIGERAFGAVLAARIAGLLDPDRAVEMADTMPIEFLADVAAELDPRRASAVISRIAPARVEAVTRELLRREEYVTMGWFVGHLHDDAVRATFDVLDDVALLRVAFVLEQKESLEHLISLLPATRRDSIVDAAAAEGMWIEVLDLISHLSDETRRQFVTVGALEREGVLEAIVGAAAANELWPELLPLVPELPVESQERLAREAAKLDPSQRERSRALPAPPGWTSSSSASSTCWAAGVRYSRRSPRRAWPPPRRRTTDTATALTARARSAWARPLHRRSDPRARRGARRAATAASRGSRPRPAAPRDWARAR